MMKEEEVYQEARQLWMSVFVEYENKEKADIAYETYIARFLPDYVPPPAIDPNDPPDAPNDGPISPLIISGNASTLYERFVLELTRYSGESILSDRLIQQENINRYLWGSKENRASGKFVVARPDGGYTRIHFPDDTASAPVKLMMRFPAIESGMVAFTWSCRWPVDWFKIDEYMGAMHTHKTFQVGRLESKMDTRRLEMRTTYQNWGVEEGTAVHTLRRYHWEAEGRDQPMPVMKPYVILPWKWYTYYLAIDLDTGDCALHIGVEGQEMVEQANWRFTDMNAHAKDSRLLNGVDSFWFQFGASSERTGPPTYVDVRNFAVRHLKSNTTAIAE